MTWAAPYPRIKNTTAAGPNSWAVTTAAAINAARIANTSNQFLAVMPARLGLSITLVYGGSL